MNIELFGQLEDTGPAMFSPCSSNPLGPFQNIDEPNSTRIFKSQRSREVQYAHSWENNVRDVGWVVGSEYDERV